jgi:ABC-type lipoprotein export system ATPase subunit
MSKEKRGLPPFFLSLDNLSFEINKKKIINIRKYRASFSNLLLIKGKIGSGKTTLLKILADIFFPTSGKYLLNNEINFKKIYIHSFPFFNFITGRIADEMLLAGKISEFEGKMPDKAIDELSGGELKKISILLSINSGYNLILADEPFNMLDDNEMENVKNTIIKQMEIASFIITTHEDILDDYADEIIRLEDGCII